MKNHFRIDYLLITNLEREQAFRNGNPELVLKEILKKIDKTTKLILNADDPFTGKIMNLYKGSKPIYYGVNKNAKSNSSTCNLIDIAYCPKCSSKLNFNYFNYDNIGSFNCTKCDYKNPKTNYNISKIDFKKDTIFFDKLSLKINNCLPYNIYNYSAAYALLRTIGLKEKKIIDGFKKRTFDKNNKSYVYKGRNTYFVLSKPECAPSFNQSINHLLEKKELITVVFGLSEISRRYPEQDISWLYDINFEALKNVKIDKIICIGDYAYDLATRLKYADIEDNKILIETKLKNLNLALSKTKGDIYALIYHGALKKVFDKEVGEK